MESPKIEIDAESLREFRELVERLVAAAERAADIAEQGTRRASMMIDDGK